MQYFKSTTLKVLYRLVSLIGRQKSESELTFCRILINETVSASKIPSPQQRQHRNDATEAIQLIIDLDGSGYG